MSRKKNDLIRFVILILLIVGIVVFDSSNMAVVQAVLIGSLFALGSHITRRILFPDLDLQLIARKAYEQNNLGAAIVLACLCAVLMMTMYAGMHILRG